MAIEMRRTERVRDFAVGECLLAVYCGAVFFKAVQVGGCLAAWCIPGLFEGS